MELRELVVGGALEVTPHQHRDTRGLFLEQFRAKDLTAQIGHPFAIRQVNTSVSHRGVVRGIHYADVPPGQAKYVTVPYGAILDFIIDLRVGSSTYGTWDSVVIDSAKRNAVYLGEGLGHAFVALEDNTVVTYMVSEYYNPTKERAINPLDVDVSLEFPDGLSLSFSEKDAEAPSLAELLSTGLLPSYQAIQELQANQNLNKASS